MLALVHEESSHRAHSRDPMVAVAGDLVLPVQMIYPLGCPKVLYLAQNVMDFLRHSSIVAIVRSARPLVCWLQALLNRMAVPHFFIIWHQNLVVKIVSLSEMISRGMPLHRSHTMYSKNCSAHSSAVRYF